MQNSLLTVDLGPAFGGWVGVADGRKICVAPTGIDESEEAQHLMRETVKRTGGDCKECRGCWLGT